MHYIGLVRRDTSFFIRLIRLILTISTNSSFDSTSRFNLRLHNDILRFNVPRRPHYKKSENAFCHSAPQVWNSLPFEVRDANTLGEFKTRLKTYYFRCAFS